MYHEIECDYKGNCTDCPHNTEKDTEWFEQDQTDDYYKGAQEEY